MNFEQTWSNSLEAERIRRVSGRWTLSIRRQPLLDSVKRLTETCLLLTGSATSIREPELFRVAAVCWRKVGETGEMIVAYPPGNSNRFERSHLADPVIND